MLTLTLTLTLTLILTLTLTLILTLNSITQFSIPVLITEQLNCTTIDQQEFAMISTCTCRTGLGPRPANPLLERKIEKWGTQISAELKPLREKFKVHAPML